VVIIAVMLATQQIPYWGRAPATSTFFVVSLPPVLRDHRANFVIIDDEPNGYVVTGLPLADTVVRWSDSFPLVGPMRRAARSILPATVPTYVLYGDPSEAGAPAVEVALNVPVRLADLGFVLDSDRACLQFSVSFDDVPYDMYACPLSNQLATEHDRSR
jgi:hypothetical protein